MIEEYLNKQKLLNREVFRKIQYYYFKNNIKSENRQWALLNGLKPKDLKQLLKNSHFVEAFNALIDI